jgi:hypothetical protein
MKVRRKSLWRSKNNQAVRKFANMRAAKERKRIERLSLSLVLPDTSHLVAPKCARPLFTITIRCRDGAVERLRIYERPFGLSISPTMVGRKIAAAVGNYRPI